MASRMLVTAEQLTQSLAQAGIDVETIKERIRADIAWSRYQERRWVPPRQWHDPLPGNRNNS